MEQSKEERQLMQDALAIPKHMRNTYHWSVDSRFAYTLFHKVLPKLGFGKVLYAPVEVDGKTYHKIMICMPGVRIDLHLTGVGVHFLGSYIKACLQQHWMLSKVEGCLIQDSPDGKVGPIFIPTWALRKVLDVCIQICKENETSIKFDLFNLNTELDKLENKPVLH